MKPTLEQAAKLALMDGFYQIPCIAMPRGGKLRFSHSLNGLLAAMVPKNLPERMDMERIALNLKTTNSLRHSYGTQVNTYAGADFIELARIPSHYGLVTTLRQINTFLGSPEGIPINVRDAVNVFQTRVFKYYLVYTPVESGDQYIYSAAYAGELKGHIVYEHPPWDDNRYQYGVPDVELTIPLIPHYNCSLFAEKQFIPPNYIPPWDDQNLRYVRGDIVEYDGDLWVARYDNDPIVANRPDNDPNLWENIGDTVDTDLMVYGCLEASFQSEDSLSAIWQARRTFIT